MATIRATCSHCYAPVPLEPAAVVLRADLPADPVDHADAERTVLGAYSFLCGSCGAVASRSADAAAVRLLLLAGVWADPELAGDSEVRTRPGLLHPEAPPSGPAFTKDDLLDLHRVLAGDDWFARLAGVVPRPLR